LSLSSGFSSLGLSEPLLRAVEAAGYTTPTPIQAQAIPPLLDGRDVLGCAQTGTGKTAAFTLPVLQHIAAHPPAPGRRSGPRPVRALVLTPTRELAAQIDESVATYGRYLSVSHTVLFGGVKQGPQVQRLRRGVDVLVATPGRLLDLVGQGYVDLSSVEFFVLDEADRMLDMGFIHDVRRVLKVLPPRRQNLLFSATMPSSIVRLAGSFLSAPVRVEVTPQATTVDKIQQSVMFCARPDKRRLLARLIHERGVESAIVFTRTKHGANRLVGQLEREGIQAAAIHGNKSQGARTRALSGFKDGTIPILVATDIASRGIDVDGVSHIFNFDLPNVPESYVHRIGRTARAGREGVAIALCDETEGALLRDIERLIGREISVDEDHPWHLPTAIPPAASPRGAGRRTPPSRGSRSGVRSRRRGRGAGRTGEASGSPPRAAQPGPGGHGEASPPPRRRPRQRRKIARD